MAASERPKLAVVTPNPTARAEQLRKRLPKPILTVRKRCQLRLTELLNECFSASDDHFFDLAKNAKIQADQDGYFCALRELRNKKSKVFETFFSNLDQGFLALADEDGIIAPPSSFVATRFDQLAIVGHDELEQLVAKEAMASRALAQYKMLLEQLARRFDAVVPADVNVADLPVCPSRLCDFFLDACSTLDVNSRSMIVLFKVFERTVVQALGSLYAGMNEHLEERGILPSPVRPTAVTETRLSANSVSPNPMSVGAMSSAQMASNPMSSNPMSTSARVQANAGAAAQPYAASPSFSAQHHTGGVDMPLDMELLNVSGNSLGVPLPPATGPVGAAPLNAYMGSAGMASHGMVFSGMASPGMEMPSGNMASPHDGVGVSGDASISTASHPTRVGHSTNSPAKGQSGSSSEIPLPPRSRSAQVIENTMAMLGQGYGIADPVVRLMGQLQSRLTQIAQADDTFFSSEEHALRRLMNRLSSSAFTFGKANHDDIEHDPLFMQIKTIVAKLQGDAYSDPRNLSALLEEFERFVSQEQRRVDLYEKRMFAAEQGKYQTEIAQKQVQAAIAEITQGLTLHSTVRNILDKAWRQVLLINALKYGVDSPQWDEASQTLTDLVISTQPYYSAMEKAQSLTSLKGLKLRVRMGLESLFFDSFETDNIVQQLDDTIRQLTQEPIATPSESASPKSEVVPPVEPTLPPMIEIPVENPHEQAFIAQAKNLGRGSWFDLKDDGQEIRCRLAAIIGNYEKYIFVQRNGSKIAEKMLDEVARALAEQTLVALDSNKIFDLALEQVIKGLKKNQ